MEELKELAQHIQEFKENKNESIFCLFLGVVNHWTTFIIHKQKGSDGVKYYFLDSGNLEFLDKMDE